VALRLALPVSAPRGHISTTSCNCPPHAVRNALTPRQHLASASSPSSSSLDSFHRVACGRCTCTSIDARAPTASCRFCSYPGHPLFIALPLLHPDRCPRGKSRLAVVQRHRSVFIKDALRPRCLQAVCAASPRIITLHDELRRAINCRSMRRCLAT
jgi:hypothetical protein